VDIAPDGDVLVCTIRRPQIGGALRHVDCVALANAIEEAGFERMVRAVLIRSEGRNFCTGADLANANPPRVEGVKPTRRAVGSLAAELTSAPHRLIDVLWSCPLPTLAAVQGRAAGLGLHLALACDVVVAGQGASFSEPFLTRGFSADSGGTFLLPRLVGLARAKKLLYFGRPISAVIAETWGLIAEVVADDNLERASRSMVEELAAGPTVAIGLTKASLQRHQQSGDITDALRAEAGAVELSVRSDDFKEGIRAFNEKRPPVFHGR
jgi:2-(1,2-epoxy-1,2-dihydrophenyl)acetyl-CoA isomerase